MTETHAPTTTGDAPATTQTVRGTVTYLLSTAGQAASLLAGGDGWRQQTTDVAIPADLLGLCALSEEGTVTLDLSAHWPEVRVYDTPPRIIDAPCQAGTVFQLRRSYPMYHDAPLTDPIAAYYAALAEARAKLADAKATDDARIARLRAESRRYLLDAAHAVLAGSDTPDLSGVNLSQRLGRLSDDDEVRITYAAALAAQESRLRAAKAAQEARQAAVAQAKAAYLNAWVAEHGTEDQRERYEAGLLPTAELMAAIEAWAFADLADVARYARITARDVAALFDDEAVEIDEDDITCKASDADEASAAQWAALKALRARVADDETATVSLRRHRCWWDRRAKPDDPEVVRYGLLVRRRRGPLVLEREFAAPDAE